MCEAEGDGTGGATPNNGLCVSTWGPVTNLAILAVMRADRVRVEGAAFFVTVVAVIRRFISTVLPKCTKRSTCRLGTYKKLVKSV